MKKIQFVLVSFVVLSLCDLEAEEIVLDLNTAVDMALQHNLSLQSEMLSFSQKKRNADTRWNSLVPSVSLSTSLSRANESSGTSASPWGVSVGLSASVTLSARLFLSMQQTVLDFESGALAVEKAKAQLARDVKKAFYNLLLTEENLKLSRQNIEAAAKRYEQAKKNFEFGLASKYTMLSARVSWENLKPEYEDMAIAYRETMESFKYILGIDAAVTVSLKGRIEVQNTELDAENLIASRINDRFDIQTLQQTAKTLENTLRQNYASLMPSLTLRFTMDPSFQGDPFKDPWFSDIGNMWKQQSGGLYISVSVPVDSLIPGSAAWTAIANTEDAMRQNRLELQKTRRNAELEITNIIKRLQKSLLSLDTLRLNVELAEEAYKLAEESYNAGGKEILEVQNAELELQKAKLAVLSEEYNYATGLVDLEYALNVKQNLAGVEK